MVRATAARAPNHAAKRREPDRRRDGRAKKVSAAFARDAPEVELDEPAAPPLDDAHERSVRDGCSPLFMPDGDGGAREEKSMPREWGAF